MKKVQLTFVFSLILSCIFAQSIITGKVTSGDGEGLIAANVAVFNPDGKDVIAGAATEYDGNFELKLEAGTYDLQFSYIGFEDKWMKNVVLKTGEKKVLNVVLEEGGATLDAVMVVEYKVPLVESSASSHGVMNKAKRAGKKSVRSAVPPASYSTTRGEALGVVKEKKVVAVFSPETYEETIMVIDEGTEDGDMIMEDMEDDVSLGGHTFAIPLAEHYSLEDVVVAASPPKAEKPRAGQLTAGEQNALNRWSKWKKSLKKEYKNVRENWAFNTENRYAVRVLDENDNPVADCKVLLKSKTGKALWEARTNNKGTANLWGNPFEESDQTVGKIIVEHKGEKYPIKKAKPFSKSVNILRLPFNVYDNPCNADILFVVDATGSMGDEINYLKSEMEDVINRTQKSNESLFLRTGSVFYRDEGDAYVTKNAPFSHDISVTDNFIQQQSAGGGGNYPEAVHSALEEAINNFEWSEDAIARVLFLVLDAPPHQFPEVIKSMQSSIEKAAALGIRIVPVTASGIRQETEFLMKSFAVMTNGTYVFITDHSGIGNGHMAPTDDDFEVEFLNDVMVRLINDFCKNSSCEDIEQQNDSVADRTTILDKDKTGSVTFSTVKFFPNPADAWVTIQLEEAIDEVQILNMNSQLVLQKMSISEGNTDLNISNIAAGIYIIRFRKGKGIVSGKLVVGRR